MGDIEIQDSTPVLIYGQCGHDLGDRSKCSYMAGSKVGGWAGNVCQGPKGISYYTPGLFGAVPTDPYNLDLEK